MKRMIVGVLFILGSFSLIIAAGPAAGENVVLKGASAWPQNHDGNHDFFKFFEIVKEKTGGSVTIEWAGGPELAKPRDLPTSAAAGTLDVFTTAPGYYGGIVGEGPILDAFPAYRDFESAPRVFDKMLPILTPEYGKKLKIKPLAWTWVVPFYMWTKKSIQTFEDMKGLKIRAHGGLVPHIARALGVSPVTMPSTDVYMALERGVVDGAIRNLASYNVFKEFELTKFGISSPVTWATNLLFISLRSWDKLSQQQQEALSEAGEEVTVYSANYWQKKNGSYMNKFDEQGVTFFDLPPEMKKEWEERILKGGKEGAMKLSPKHAEEMIRVFQEYGAK